MSWLPSRTATSSLLSTRNQGLKRFRNNLRVQSQLRCITIRHLDQQRNNRKRVVVLGSGWAGYGFARDLDPSKYQVVVVSPRSYFVFTPLLAGTSVGTLEFRTAVEPVRSRKFKGEYFQGWADKIDFSNRILTVEEGLYSRSLASETHHEGKEVQHQQNPQVLAPKGDLFDLRYDELVIAVGCYNQTFNTKGVKENAYFLRDVGDARKIRKRILSCFEMAALPTTSEKMRNDLLNFAIVGGGPSGIEWAAELHDLVHEDMKRLYPDIVQHARITVYDVAQKVLPMFDEKLSQYAMQLFNREGIEIKTNHHVKELRQHESDGITSYTLNLQEEGEIGIGMCVWSTGLMMNPFIQNALSGKVKQNSKTGGIVTNERLQVQSKEGSSVAGLYALGDCANMEGNAYPATAQVASQQAQWLAKRFNKGDVESKNFSFRNMGTMAYLGNWNAILQSQSGSVSGRTAWFIWRSAYLVKSVSWRNRILIPVYWALNWLFGRDVSRF